MTVESVIGAVRSSNEEVELMGRLLKYGLKERHRLGLKNLSTVMMAKESGGGLPKEPRVSIIMPDDHDRLVMELEFIQCLANPAYLSFLSQQGYLSDTKFIAYLTYLQYWHQPEYASLVSYPNSLYFLKALLNEPFRRELANPECINHIHRQQYHHWLNKRNV